jgi:capping protein (actin filament) muscle Z-line, alpha
MSSTDICSSFIQGAPPGELSEVVNDIKALTADNEPDLLERLKPAFQKYNEDQLLAVKLPGGSQHVRDPLPSPSLPINIAPSTSIPHPIGLVI